MSSTSFEYALVGVASLLKQGLLGVPFYQRSYSWAPDYTKDYWDDLVYALGQPGHEYFLGTVVLTSDGSDGRHLIIDGQQRIATTALLLTAIRDEYNRLGVHKKGAVVQRYLADGDLGTGEDVPKLVLNSDDDVFFAHLMLDPTKPTATKPSHELLELALDFFRSKIMEVSSGAGANWESKLKKWVDYLTSDVRVIAVTVPTEADAFLIFETLNARGADLTIADLLKNYLFGHAKLKLDGVRDGWMQVLGALDITAETPLFTVFLRNYWSSHYGATRERDLYREIKEHITSATQVADFVADLQKSAYLFAALRSSDHEFWSSMGTAAKANVETLLRLDLEQNRPMLLAAMQHLSKADLKKLLRATVSWSVRGLIVGGIGGGATERAYCNAAIKIRDGSLKTTADIRSDLSPVLASDGVFQASFAVARVPKASSARYYLRALEGAVAGVQEPELVANSDEELVNLEHVLPKSYKLTEWPSFANDDEAKTNVHQLGNMVLLAKGPNDKLGNKKWTAKKPVLAKSSLELTKQAGSQVDWSPSVIAARQTKMAEIAVKVWPR